VTFDQIFDLLTGEAGVVALLLIAVVLFFRGGIVTGKAHEKALLEFKEDIERERTALKEARAETVFWRDTALRMLKAAEELGHK
jgi:hypothetical protein